MQANITTVVATLTLISNIVFVIGVAALIFVSFAALVGSLAFSNIVGFPPCELCWIQRIFMYPQALLAFMAMRKKDKNIVGYLFPLSILGGLVAFYHSLVQWGIGGGALGCTSVGGACVKVYVLEYSYVTIPFMALSAFVYLIALSVVYYLSKKSVQNVSTSN